MKKFSIFAIAIAAAVFAACGGNKSAKSEAETDSLKSFEQQQIEASIKMHLDSIGAEIGKLEQPKFLNEGEDGITLTKEEKQVKPDYLFAATVADNATTLPEKYRAMSALAIDKKVAKLYEMPTEDYDKAIGKLTAEINDPSFKVLENEANTYETTSALYDAMEKNGRINYFWQMAAATLVEQLYVANQNADKFLSVLNDEAAANLTFRVVLILDAINRLAQYDPDMMPVVNALAPLEVINSTTVDELKKELAEVKDKVAEARAALVK